MTRPLIIASILLTTIGGCDRPPDSEQAPSALDHSSVSAPRTLDDRLLANREERRQWPIAHVKLWLANPTVRTTLTSSDGTSMEVDAWGANENDFHTAMMRLDLGEVLYALTEAELEELRDRASATTVP